MCRAIWAVAVGPDEAACGRLRRLAGADVQVIAMATTPARVQELLGENSIDVMLLDAATPDAYGIVSATRRSFPKVAVVWVGESAPETVHADVPHVDGDPDRLASAVTRALISRRA